MPKFSDQHFKQIVCDMFINDTDVGEALAHWCDGKLSDEGLVDRLKYIKQIMCVNADDQIARGDYDHEMESA